MDERKKQTNRRLKPRLARPPMSCGVGSIVDASADGLCVRLKQSVRVRPGDCIKFRIGNTGAVARVVWCRKGLFKREIGLHFETMTSELRQELRRAVAEALNMGVMHEHKPLGTV